MEEHRPDQGYNPHCRQASRQGGRRGHGPDHVRDRPQGSRHEIRDRLAEAAEGARVGAEPPVRGRHREDRQVVSREPGVARQCHERRLPEVLRADVRKALTRSHVRRKLQGTEGLAMS